MSRVKCRWFVHLRLVAFTVVHHSPATVTGAESNFCIFTGIFKKCTDNTTRKEKWSWRLILFRFTVDVNTNSVFFFKDNKNEKDVFCWL